MTVIKGNFLNPKTFARDCIVSNKCLKHFFHYNSENDRNIFFSFEIDDSHNNIFNLQVENDVNLFIDFKGQIIDKTRYKEHINESNATRERILKEINLHAELFTYNPMLALKNTSNASNNIKTRMDYLNYACYCFKNCFKVANGSFYSENQEQSLLSFRFDINQFYYWDVVETTDEDNVDDLYLDKIEVVKYK